MFTLIEKNIFPWANSDWRICIWRVSNSELQCLLNSYINGLQFSVELSSISTRRPSCASGLLGCIFALAGPCLGQECWAFRLQFVDQVSILCVVSNWTSPSATGVTSANVWNSEHLYGVRKRLYVIQKGEWCVCVCMLTYFQIRQFL